VTINEYPASYWADDADFYVANWDQNLPYPVYLTGTGYLRMKWTAVGAATSVDVGIETWNVPTATFVTIAGGPWSVGDTVVSPSFAVDLGTFYSADIYIPYGSYPGLPAGISYSPGYTAEDVVLVMTDQTAP
jgi:hypothetical protein